MKEQEIIEGNKLIAEFIGCEIERDGRKGIGNLTYNLPAMMFEPDFFEIQFFMDTCDMPNKVSNMLFHKSWDWLIPAIQKFDSLPLYSNLEYIDHCEKIDSIVTCYEVLPAFYALVEAIKWYNNQPNQ